MSRSHASSGARRRARLSSTLVLAIAGWAASSAVAYPPAKHYRHTPCNAGRTVFHRGATRAFIVSSKDPETGGPHQRMLLCGSASRSPRLIEDGGGDAELAPLRFEVEGSRLAFAIEVDTLLSHEAPVEVGWIGLRGGAARSGPLGAVFDPDYVLPQEPLLPFYRVSLAVAPDGWMAVISAAKSGCQVVSVLAVRPRRFADGYLLEVPSVLHTAVNGGLDQNSLKIDDSTVNWESIGGVPASAVRSAGTPATGTMSAQTGGC